MSEKEAYKELLIDKKERVESIVEKAKPILGIEDESGEMHLRISRAKLTDEDLIGLHLIGRFFASELGLVESPSIGYRELSERIGTKESVVAARLHDLKSKGYVRSPQRGAYEIVFPRISEFLDIIRQKAGIA